MADASDLAVRPISGALGAEVRGLDLATLDDAGFEALRAVLREHLVVFLPDQHASPDAHRDLGCRFGELEVHPYMAKLDADHPEIVRLESEQGMIADVWHIDMTFHPQPSKFSVAQMLACPATGGDTMWANMQLAYEALSAPMREALLDLSAINTAAVHGHPEARAEHPVVRVHPDTGRPSLYVCRLMTARVVQLSPGESDALLRYLFDVSEQPQFTCRWAWTPGTVAIWDNRATQHYVVNDFVGRRTQTRVTVTGDVPEPAGNIRRWPPFTARLSAATNR